MAGAGRGLGEYALARPGRVAVLGRGLVGSEGVALAWFGATYLGSKEQAVLHRLPVDLAERQPGSLKSRKFSSI